MFCFELDLDAILITFHLIPTKPKVIVAQFALDSKESQIVSNQPIPLTK